MNELKIIEAPELKLIEETKSREIISVFKPMAVMLSEFEDDYNGIIEESKNGIDEKLIIKSKRLRLDIAKVRINAEKARKARKEQILREGKAIDGISNILKFAVTDKENNLKKIETHFEELEKQRLEKLQFKRVKELSDYVEDAHERDLSSMDDDVWIAYLTTKKSEYECRVAAEKKAEQERIAKIEAEKAEQERIKKENEKLKAEALERERRAKIEAERRAKIESERLKREAAIKKKQEEYKAKLKKEREERERIEREERLKREKLEAELRAKKEAERKLAEEKEAALQVELNKGDAEKIKDMVLRLESVKSDFKFKSKKNKTLKTQVDLLIDKVINYVTK